MNQHSIYL